MIKMLIADDHIMVRQGLMLVFAQVSDIVVSGEATNAEETIKLLQECPFDVLLLDLNMPGMNGVSLIGRVHAKYKKLPILVLSMHHELQIAKRVLEAGAMGFVTKGSDKQILISAVRKVVSGERFLDPTIAAQMLFSKPARQEDMPHERLSPRELQIMKMLVKGLGTNEIAAELCISNRTVSTHKSRILQKMELTNAADLVRYSIGYNLFE